MQQASAIMQAYVPQSFLTSARHHRLTISAARSRRRPPQQRLDAMVPSPSSHTSRHTRVTANRFIERVTNNVEICITDIHCRLECGGPDFHIDESRHAWPHFAVGLQVPRFYMGREPPPDAKKVSTSFRIGACASQQHVAPCNAAADVEGVSLYWDRQLPPSSIFSAGCAARIQLRTEPSFAIVVCEPSPANPDLHAGDIILAIGDLQAPPSLHAGDRQQQQRVFDRSHSFPAPFRRRPHSHFPQFLFCPRCSVRPRHRRHPTRTECSPRDQDQAGLVAPS